MTKRRKERKMKPKEIRKHKFHKGALKTMNINNHSIGNQPLNQGSRRKPIIALILAGILLIMVTACQKPTETANAATPTLAATQKKATTTKSTGQGSKTTPTETGYRT